MEMLLAGMVGLIVGALIASVVWMKIGSGGKKKLEVAKREKEELMLSIGRLLADADAIETDFRRGGIPRARFTRSLGEKVNEITRALRTNMHSLDVFFVKYAEQQAEEYMRLIENPERRKSAVPGDGQPSAEEGEDVSSGEEADAGFDPDAGFDDKPKTQPIPVEKTDNMPALMGGPDWQRGKHVTDTFPAVVASDEEAREPEAEPEPALETARDDDEFVIPSAEPRADGGAPAETQDGEERQSREEQANDADSFEAPAAEISNPAADDSEPEADTEAKPEEDSWSEQSLEDYEAGFAQFEEQSGDQDEIGRETGGFFINVAADAPESNDAQEDSAAQSVSEDIAAVPEPSAEEPSAADAVQEQQAADDDDDDIFEVTAAPVSSELEFTETISYDRSADDAAAAAASPTYPYARPPIQPDQSADSASPDQSSEEQDIAAGITGDDVGDAIDNFFKLR